MTAPTTDIALVDPDRVPRRMTLDEKIKYAQTLAAAGLVPTAYRNQPANVLYAVEYGEMLGLAPLAAITGIHIIEGKPSASAGLIGALVRRAGHRLRVTGDDTSATAEIVRVDDPDFVFRSTWTLDRARAARLLDKDTWKKYPAAMLKARAISEVARDACEEALSGVHYTPEELGAMVDEDGDPVATTVEFGDPVRDGDSAPGGSPLDIALVGIEASTTVDQMRDVWRRHAGSLSTPEKARLQEAVKARTALLEAAGADTTESATEPDPTDGDDGDVVDAEIVDDTDHAPAGDGFPGDPDPVADDAESGQPATQTQLKELGAALMAVGLSPSSADKPKIAAICSYIAGRPIKQRTHLTRAEAVEVLGLLAEIKAAEDPAGQLELVLTAAMSGAAA